MRKVVFAPGTCVSVYGDKTGTVQSVYIGPSGDVRYTLYQSESESGWTSGGKPIPCEVNDSAQSLRIRPALVARRTAKPAKPAKPATTRRASGGTRPGASGGRR